MKNLILGILLFAVSTATADSLVLLVCHQVGHLFAGNPKKRNGAGWSSLPRHMVARVFVFYSPLKWTDK